LYPAVCTSNGKQWFPRVSSALLNSTAKQAFRALTCGVLEATKPRHLMLLASASRKSGVYVVWRWMANIWLL
jgi:hypothetical protein